MTTENRLLLNLGCGTRIHPAWTNLDLVPRIPGVLPANLAEGIPFPDDSADVVYHSHLLEHLNPRQATEFIRECYRVLAPGGILRVVVPDLEQISRVYLATLERAWDDASENNLANHRWMQLEILDQLIRTRSGGKMGEYLSRGEIPNLEFIRNRMGAELDNCQAKPDRNATDRSRSITKRSSGIWQRVKNRWKRSLLKLLFGRQLLNQLDEMQFRNSGEIHQWMYDRVSLRSLLTANGFERFRICSSTESRIDGFAGFELDSVSGETLKPDSLFAEACKPVIAAKSAA